MSRRYSLSAVDLYRYSLDTICPRSRLFIYTGRGRIGKFEFVLTRRLHVAATLFFPEFTCSYITCILTVLILRDKTTTWFELSSNSCAATDPTNLTDYFHESYSDFELKTVQFITTSFGSIAFYFIWNKLIHFYKCLLYK